MRFHRDPCNKTKKPKLPWCRWTLEVDSERWDAAQWAGALGSFVSTEKGEILHSGLHLILLDSWLSRDTETRDTAGGTIY